MSNKLIMKPFFVQLEINPNLYLNDPQKTKLGRKIIEQSVLLIDEIGNIDVHVILIVYVEWKSSFTYFVKS